MNLYVQGLTCNANAHQLFEKANGEGISFEEYPDWITEKMNEMAIPLPEWERYYRLFPGVEELEGEERIGERNEIFEC